jgi:hypothetical protein
VQQSQSKNEPLFTNYKGADVLGSDGKSIGAVADVVVDTQGDVKQLILSHGGLIGIGATLNAYDVQQMPALNDGKVKLGLTTASLEQLPKFEYPSGNGKAPAEGRASTTAPMAGSSGASIAPNKMSAPPASSAAPTPSVTGTPSASATPPAGGSANQADQTAMNKAASDAAGSSASTSVSGTMWPVSYIVGADIHKGDKTAAIGDARFEGGKLSAVIVSDGTDLGLGKGQQQIAFNELTISGTPKTPQITLSGGGAAGASPPPAAAPSSPSSTPGTTGGMNK